jgi:hypothetical protein
MSEKEWRKLVDDTVREIYPTLSTEWIRTYWDSAAPRLAKRVLKLEARLRTMRDAFAIIRDITDSPQVVEIARRFAEEVGDE